MRLMVGSILCSASVLLGCESMPGNRSSATVEHQAATERTVSTSRDSGVVAEDTASGRGKRSSLVANIQLILNQAEEAFAANRLTTPAEDNAYDRYRAVLLLDKGNEQALTGITAIFGRYAELARDAIRRGNFYNASDMIDRARSVDANAAELQVLERELKQARATRPAAKPVVRLSPPNENEIILDRQNLRARNDEIKVELKTLAEELRENKKSMMIVARTDEEARWIYRQMAEAVIGYRIRGDVRIGKTPKILLMPPIE
ncbi:hypothetical protein [Aurantivibrio plasticivorans]